LSKIVKDRENLLFLNHQAWDSGFFSRDAYTLEVEKSTIVQAPKDEKIFTRELPKSFITTKFLSNIDPKCLNTLMQYGFSYIDTEVVLRFDNRKVMVQESDYRIKDVIQNVDLPYVALGSTFLYSRFHNDINITNEKADALWIAYLKNYQPSKTKKMFVAYDAKEAVGVILVNISSNQEATLFYVAVTPSHQAQGIGKLLIDYALYYLQKNSIKTIRTETQIKNINALNFYIRSGFGVIEKTLTVLHRWG
jgi:dTDP-4-amino-4,6-dideoxy-D-galactose acyltransferase